MRAIVRLPLALLLGTVAAGTPPPIKTWQGCTCRDVTVDSCAHHSGFELACVGSRAFTHARRCWVVFVSRSKKYSGCAPLRRRVNKETERPAPSGFGYCGTSAVAGRKAVPRLRNAADLLVPTHRHQSGMRGRIRPTTPAISRLGAHYCFARCGVSRCVLFVRGSFVVKLTAAARRTHATLPTPIIPNRASRTGTGRTSPHSLFFT